ncbi:MAG: CDP-diacylglycerol--serine O-phosphatidyltransferase [Alphaproteobacteria bacterium]|nr:CDP-diacylglycerol--serine O-phosphatidyltransferase [Alphaproteobacteria bacterium]
MARQPIRRRRLRALPFNRMIPNILTLLALCAGLSAIRYGLIGQWEKALLAIMAAAVLDGLDGRIARMLKGTSKFGAELDSLADFVSFGVVPPMVLYLWTLQEAGRFGWILVLLYSVCMVLRLARFNTLLEDVDQPAWAANFFTGVPAPMGAGLVLLPMALWLVTDSNMFRNPYLVSFVMISVAALLVSRIPTFSFKKVKIPSRWVLPTMLSVGLYAALLINTPWATVAVTLLVYLVSIPFGIRAHRRMAERGGDEAEEADELDEIEEPADPTAADE